MDRRMDRRMDGRMNGWKDGWLDGRTDIWMGGHVLCEFLLEVFIHSSDLKSFLLQAFK